VAKNDPKNCFLSESDSMEPLENAELSQETVDLEGLFMESVSASGSYDLRNLRLGSMGRLLEILPIPVVLLNELYEVVFANQSCCRMAANHAELVGKRFSSVFPNEHDREKVASILDKVYRYKMPILAEGVLGVDRPRMWGRMRFRAIRINANKLIIVMIEDITWEKELDRLRKKKDVSRKLNS